MRIEKAYDSWAASYDSDRNRTRDLDARVLRRVLGRRRFARVLELGCGTGKNTVFLARKAKEVDALDFSAGMLARAAARPGLSNVSFARCDLRRAWPVSGKFDLISCDLVLEHIRELRPVFAQAASRLSPGGALFVCEFHPFRQYEGKKARFENERGTVHVGAFVHDVSDFIDAGLGAGLRLESLGEWKRREDRVPRLISFIFRGK